MTYDDDAYREFVTGRIEGWRRTAYLICGDWHAADDMVQNMLLRLYLHWRKAAAADRPDAYARRMLVRAVLNERRRPWRRERPSHAPPDQVARGRGPDQVPGWMAVMELLAELPPRRRAVLVLRYFCDLTVDETAAELGCSSGTVKSQTARALDGLRGRLAGSDLLMEEA